MRMDVMLVHMGTAYEGMVAMRQFHSKVITYPVRCRRVGLARFETDAEMVRYHVAGALVAPCDGSVLVLGEQELGVRSSLSRVFSYIKINKSQTHNLHGL